MKYTAGTILMSKDGGDQLQVVGRNPGQDILVHRTKFANGCIQSQVATYVKRRYISALVTKFGYSFHPPVQLTKSRRMGWAWREKLQQLWKNLST